MGNEMTVPAGEGVSPAGAVQETPAPLLEHVKLTLVLNPNSAVTVTGTLTEPPGAKFREVLVELREKSGPPT